MKLLVAVILFTAIAAFGFRQSEILSAQNVRVSGNVRDDVSSVVRMIRVSDGEINKWLGISGALERPMEELTVEIDGEGTGNAVGVVVLVDSSESFLVTFYNLIRAQVLRRARQLTGEKSRRNLKSADWIAAAICHRIVHGGKGIRWNYQPDYSRQLRMYSQGNFPDVAIMLDNPPPAVAGNFFLLYLMHCDAFAFCLEDRRPSTDGFRQIFAMEYYGRPASEAVTLAFQSSFAPGETLQAWFQRVATVKCVAGRSQNSLEAIQDRLERLLMIPVANGDGGIDQVPIRDIPSRFRDYQPDVTALSLLQNDIVQLQQGAPVLLHAPMAEFLQAIDALKSNDKSAFTRKFDAAQVNFADAMARLKVIHTNLDTLEDAQKNEFYRVGEMLRIFDKYDSLQFQF